MLGLFIYNPIFADSAFDRLAMSISDVPLYFRRKLPRDYVHGTDVFNAVQELTWERTGDSEGRLDIGFHLQARHQCVAHIMEGRAQKAPKMACSTFRFRSRTVELYGWLIEDDRPLDEEMTYNEGSFVQYLPQEAPSVICYSGQSGFSTAEVAVAATKELHIRHFPDAGRWMLSGYRAVQFWPMRVDEAKLQSRLVSTLHNRLTRTEIYFDEMLIGTLSFSAIAAS